MLELMRPYLDLLGASHPASISYFDSALGMVVGLICLVWLAMTLLAVRLDHTARSRSRAKSVNQRR